MTPRSLSRRQLAVLAGGASATLLAACGGGADSGSGDTETAQFGKGDVGILNYVLTLEHLNAVLYTSLLQSDLLKGFELQTIREFAKQEAEHRTALVKVVERLGGRPAKGAQHRFKLSNRESALATAGEIENLIAAAYLDQVPQVQNPGALATLASIHTIEARQAAAIDIFLRRPFRPDGAFAEPHSVRQTLRAVQPLTIA